MTTPVPVSQFAGPAPAHRLEPRLWAMDRVSEADEIRRLLAGPDVAIGSVAAITETGSLVMASALETARAQEAYGKPSAINRLLILNAEPDPGHGTVLLLRQAIGF